MDSDQIVQVLKENYPRDIRKQLVKTILTNEKSNNKDDVKDQYHLINQIFSYVLKECNWNMPTSSSQLNSKPLEIMAAAFPKLDTTKWFKEQSLMTNQSIDVVIGENK